MRRLDDSAIAAAEIDATVTRVLKAAGVPGMGLAMLNDGKIVYLKGYGLRDKEKNLSLTPQTIMSAASFTKVAFGEMVMHLVDKGQLNLDLPCTSTCRSRCRYVTQMMLRTGSQEIPIKWIDYSKTRAIAPRRKVSGPSQAASPANNDR